MNADMSVSLASVRDTEMSVRPMSVSLASLTDPPGPRHSPSSWAPIEAQTLTSRKFKLWLSYVSVHGPSHYIGPIGTFLSWRSPVENI